MIKETKIPPTAPVFEPPVNQVSFPVPVSVSYTWLKKLSSTHFRSLLDYL